MDELESYVLKFEGCLSKMDSMKELVESFLNYYRTFDDALQVEFLQRGPEDAWDEVQAVGSPQKIVMPRGICRRTAPSSQQKATVTDLENPSLDLGIAREEAMDLKGSSSASVVIPEVTSEDPKADLLDSVAAEAVAAAVPSSSALTSSHAKSSVQDVAKEVEESHEGKELSAMEAGFPEETPVDRSQFG